jgi:hypothetical protein
MAGSRQWKPPRECHARIGRTEERSPAARGNGALWSILRASYRRPVLNERVRTRCLFPHERKAPPSPAGLLLKGCGYAAVDAEFWHLCATDAATGRAGKSNSGPLRVSFAIARILTALFCNRSPFLVNASARSAGRAAEAAVKITSVEGSPSDGVRGFTAAVRTSLCWLTRRCMPLSLLLQQHITTASRQRLANRGMRISCSHRMATLTGLTLIRVFAPPSRTSQ